MLEMHFLPIKSQDTKFQSVLYLHTQAEAGSAGLIEWCWLLLLGMLFILTINMLTALLVSPLLISGIVRDFLYQLYLVEF